MGVAITLTPAQLAAVCPRAPAGAVVPLNEILRLTRSVTERRVAMLMAQLAVRSDSFTRLEEEDAARRSSTPYFGRGWIQLTGLRNYRAAGAALALDLVEHPYLVVPHNAEVTAWYWSAHRLHAFRRGRRARLYPGHRLDRDEAAPARVSPRDLRANPPGAWRLARARCLSRQPFLEREVRLRLIELCAAPSRPSGRGWSSRKGRGLL
jgi:Chitinase class I